MWSMAITTGTISTNPPIETIPMTSATAAASACDERLRRVAPHEPQRPAGNRGDVRVRIEGEHRTPRGRAEVPEQAGQRGQRRHDRHDGADEDRRPDQDAKDAVEWGEDSEARQREVRQERIASSLLTCSPRVAARVSA